MGWLAACRGLHMAALLSALGVVVAEVWVVRPALRDSFGPAAAALRRRLRRLMAASLMATLAAGLAWGLGSAAAIADAGTPGAALAALPLVLTRTWFGHALLARLALVVPALLLPASAGPARLLRGVAIAAAVALQPLIGHAGAMGGRAGAALSATEMLHLLAAGAWLGGLAPLALCVRALPPSRALVATERFLPLGLASVLVLAGSGAAQGTVLIGSWDGLAATAYGRLALLKLGLFAVLLGFACANRFALATRRRALLASLAIETAIGLGVVITAAWLASAEPAMDMPT